MTWRAINYKSLAWKFQAQLLHRVNQRFEEISQAKYALHPLLTHDNTDRDKTKRADGAVTRGLVHKIGENLGLRETRKPPLDREAGARPT